MVNAKDIFSQTLLAKELEQKGRQEGRQEGLQEGERKGQTELFLILVRIRFPEELTEAQVQTIQAASSQQIEQWALAIFETTSLQSLLDLER